MIRARQYLWRNWGAPFIIAFFLLLLVAAVEFSFGATGPANDEATYATYSLVAGVLLQIFSFVKFGSKEEESITSSNYVSLRLPTVSPMVKKLLAVFAVLIILVATGAVAYQYRTIHGVNPLTVTVDYMKTLGEPGGRVVVTFAVSAAGGSTPYTYAAFWPDGLIQNSTTGAFSRTFINQTLPSSVSVSVRSTDGQTVAQTAAITESSVSSSNSTSSSSSTTSSNSTSTSGSASATTYTVSFASSELVFFKTFVTNFTEPNGDVTISFGTSARGGTSPYNFIARWSDDLIQTDTTGTFMRTFTATQAIPASVYVTVISGNEQNASITITFASSG